MCNRMKNMYVYVAMYRREPEILKYLKIFFSRGLLRNVQICKCGCKVALFDTLNAESISVDQPRETICRQL